MERTTISATDSDHSKKILAGWLIDGGGAHAAENILITIKRGRIVEMRPLFKYHTGDEDLWRDLSGFTVMPPLTDCHVHMAISGAPNRDTSSRKRTYEIQLPMIKQHMQDCLRQGILCVRDGGDPEGCTLRYKVSDLLRESCLFRVRAAGNAWRREGRYGGFIGKAIPSGMETAAFIEKRTVAGVDHIKLIQSGINSLTEYGRQTLPQFDAETIGRVYAFSGRRGVGLMVHANGKKPVEAAMAGGCDSIEHGYFMGEDNLRKMADARITWVPTALPMKAYMDHSQYGSAQFEVASKTLEHQLEQISKARDYGVPIALGTDSGSPGVLHGKAVMQELKLLTAAGFTVEEAISCATLNAARLLKTDLTGCIAVGMPATFIAKRGGPSDILDASGVEMVVVDGEEKRDAEFGSHGNVVL